MEKIYLPIASGNLGEYFSIALITPHNYIKERIQDLQTLCNDYLVLSTKKFTNSSDCCLELILSDLELNQLKKTKQNNFFLFNGSLPISRVKNIYFYSEEKLKRTIVLSESASFIPNRMVKLCEKDENEFYEDSTFEFENINEKSDFAEKIIKFDSFLGGFAFMRLGGEHYMNYSKKYFCTLDYFNEIIKNAVSKIKQKLNIDDKNYYGLFENDNKNWENWRGFIFGAEQKILDEIQDKVPYSNNIYKQDSVKDKRELYILSVLANFGHERSPKSIKTDSLVIALVNNQIEYKEAITLFYGLKNGYKGFTKNYNFNNERQIVKFELNSKLDYVTIESIYQYIFNNKISSEFDYLNIIYPNYSNNIDKNKYKTYKIFDKEIIYKEKSTSLSDLIDNLLGTLRPINILNSLSNYFSKRNEVELTEEQKRKLNENYFNLIKEPFKNYIYEFSKEIDEFYTDKLEIEKKKSIDLINVNKKLNDELLKLKSVSIIVNEEPQKIEYDKDIKILQVNEPVIHYPPSKNVLSQNIGNELENKSNTNKELDIHKFYLEKLGISELREIAKKKGIPQKGIDKDILIKHIFDKIKEKNNLI